MKTKSEVIQTLTEHKHYLFEKYCLSSLEIFGSYARDEQNPSSDIDFLVDFKENIGIRFMDLADELEDVLGLNADLVSKNGIKDRYFQVITKGLIHVLQRSSFTH